MKEWLKRSFALLLCMIMCLSLLPEVHVHAEDAADDETVIVSDTQGEEKEDETEAELEAVWENDTPINGEFNGSTAQVDANGNLLINEENFPDDNFRSYISTSLDPDNHGYLKAEQIAGVKTIECSDMSIASLKGVEYFTAVTWLCCDRNQLTTLEVSKNTELTTLYCRENQLTTLDVSQNTKLTDLGCAENQLSTLDVSNNAALIYLSCDNNQLTALDVSNNSALTELWCISNQLAELDVSRNTALEYLWCRNNQLTALDVSNNSALTHLSCDNNQLTTLDVSQNTKLTDLSCDENQLSSLDVSQNTALTSLACPRNQLTALDVSNNTALLGLQCWDNQLAVLDLSNNTALNNLGCGSEITADAYWENDSLLLDLGSIVGTENLTKVSNVLGGSYNAETGILTLPVPVNGAPTVGASYEFNTAAVVSPNVMRVIITATVPETPSGSTDAPINGEFNGSTAQVDANGNLLINEVNFPDDNFRSYISTKFDVNNRGYVTAAQLLGVKTIYCYDMSIASLKGVEYFTSLTTLFCYFNQLTTLDVSKNIALTELYCDENQLTELDVSQNTELIWLTCYNNQIGALDVSQNAKLTVLGSAHNPLTTLDVSQNTALEILCCGDNQLTTLDVSKNTALVELSCGSNQLTTLDVSNNTAMTHLDCINNQLTTLDVSQNTELFLLDCSGNPITALDVSRNTKLAHLTCSSNKLITLDVRDLPALKRLYCDNNQLTTLDVSQNTALEHLGCDDNKLTALDLSNNTALIWLNCGSNQITELDVSRNTELTEFYCYSNHLTSLDLSQNTKMSTLDCSGQTSASSAELQGSDCIFNLGEMVGSENLDRVTNLSGGTYDSSTGIVTLDIEDGATTATVVYNYDHQSVMTESIMDVTVNITVPEKPSCNHVIVTDPAVAATCTTAGKTEGSHCSVCGEVIVAQTTIPATGHNFGEWVETKAPSLTEDGEETRTCQNPGCDVSETRAVKAVIYTVSYNANGGTGAPEAQQKLKGTALTLSPTKPVYSGYTFLGWATSSTATAAQYQPGGSYTEDKNVTLYAVWQKAGIEIGQLIVSTPQARPGETVTVDVSIAENPGICAFALQVSYDETVLELVSIEHPEIGSNSIWNINGGKVSWLSFSDTDYNGTLFTVTFKVADDAEEGTAAVTVLYESGDIGNFAEDEINPSIQVGGVNIVKRVPGDTNGDGRLNTMDLIRLMKYFNGENVEVVPGSADINGDGRENTMDLIRLMKYISGEDVEIH